MAVKSGRARCTPVKGGTTTQDEGTPPKIENSRKRAAVAAEIGKPAKPMSIFDMLKAPKLARKVATPTAAVSASLPETPAPAIPASAGPAPAATAPVAAPPAVSTAAGKRADKRAKKAVTSAALATIPTPTRSATRAVPDPLPALAPGVSTAPPPAEEPASEVAPTTKGAQGRKETKKNPSTHNAASDPTPASASTLLGEHAHTSDLKLGLVSYTCLCTCDAEAAGRWAEVVTRDVEEMSKVGSVVSVLGVDCEWAAVWHRAAGTPDRLATLQLFHHGSSGRRALVFSVAALAGKLPAALVALLGDARVAKLGVNIAGDASRIVRDFGCPVLGLYDLSNLNKVQGQKLRKAVSLEDLVQSHCPEDMHISKGHTAMTKGVRTSNWEAWPLSQEQIEYAAKDAALGVMAFVHKFGMGGSDHQLSKEALESLVNLEEANQENIVKKKAASKRKEIEGADEADPTTVDAKGPRQKKKKTDAKSASTDAVGETDSTAAAPKKDHQHFFVAMRNSILKPPNLGKKEHPQGAKDALKGVCIIVSGILDSFERKDLEKYVMEHGGSVSKSVTNKVTHLVTDHGEAGPSKLAKCKELNIPSVSEDVILEMVNKSLAQQ